MPFFLLFIGAPGCGKGTQSNNLSKAFDLPKLCMGDLVRETLDAERSDVSEGKLVNNDLINQIFTNALAKINHEKNVILDGYPRTLDQVFFLEKLKKDRKILVFYFKVNYDVLFKRVSERFSCLNCGAIYNKHFQPTAIDGQCDSCGSLSMNIRSDDKDKVLVNRLAEYDNLTKPILEYYNNIGVVTNIDASQSISEVSNLVLKLYEELLNNAN